MTIKRRGEDEKEGERRAEEGRGGEGKADEEGSSSFAPGRKRKVGAYCWIIHEFCYVGSV